MKVDAGVTRVMFVAGQVFGARMSETMSETNSES